MAVGNVSEASFNEKKFSLSFYWFLLVFIGRPVAVPHKGHSPSGLSAHSFKHRFSGLLDSSMKAGWKKLNNFKKIKHDYSLSIPPCFNPFILPFLPSFPHQTRNQTQSRNSACPYFYISFGKWRTLQRWEWACWDRKRVRGGVTMRH